MYKLILLTFFFMASLMSCQQNTTLEPLNVAASLSISGKINCPSRTLTTLNPSEYLITLMDSTGVQRETRPTADCRYSFIDLEMGHNYNIRIVRTVPSGNLTISTRGLENYFLQNPLPQKTDLGLIAADVDRNGEVDLTDLLHVRRFATGITTSLPAGSLWRFIPSAWLTINNNSAANVSIGRWQIPNLTTSVTNYDMIQVQYTDIDFVNCN